MQPFYASLQGKVRPRRSSTSSWNDWSAVCGPAGFLPQTDQSRLCFSSVQENEKGDNEFSLACLLGGLYTEWCIVGGAAPAEGHKGQQVWACPMSLRVAECPRRQPAKLLGCPENSWLNERHLRRWPGQVLVDVACLSGRIARTDLRGSQFGLNQPLCR